MRQPIKHNGYAWDNFHKLCKEDKFNQRIRKSVFKVKRQELLERGYNSGEATWFASKYVEDHYAKVAV